MGRTWRIILGAAVQGMNLHPSRTCPIHPLAAHPGLLTGLPHIGVMEGAKTRLLQQLRAESPRESPP